MSGVTAEDAENVRRQIISTTLEDIRSLVPLLKEWLEGSIVTVVGGEQKIRSSSIRFDSIEPLI